MIDSDWGSQVTTPSFKINLELTQLQIDDLYALIDTLCETNWTDPQDLMMIESLAVVMDAVEACVKTQNASAPEVGHKWEGVACGAPGCSHSSNYHANQRGLCCAESCGCMAFVNSGRAL